MNNDVNLWHFYAFFVSKKQAGVWQLPILSVSMALWKIGPIDLCEFVPVVLEGND